MCSDCVRLEVPQKCKCRCSGNDVHGMFLEVSVLRYWHGCYTTCVLEGFPGGLYPAALSQAGCELGWKFVG